MNLSTLIIASHEVGHFIDAIINVIIKRIMKFSTLLFFFNRLMIIPFLYFTFIINLIKLNHINNSFVLGFLLVFFYFTSVVRITTCVRIESKASKISKEYLNRKELLSGFDEKELNRYYFTAMYGQLTLAIVVLCTITMLVMCLLKV